MHSGQRINVMVLIFFTVVGFFHRQKMEKTVKLLIILFLFFILPKYLFSETQDILEIDIYPKTSITSYKPIPLSNVLPSVTIINNDTIENTDDQYATADENHVADLPSS